MKERGRGKAGHPVGVLVGGPAVLEDQAAVTRRIHQQRRHRGSSPHTWCEGNIKPWVVDHIAIDSGMVRRWQGDDIDLTARLTSDLIVDAVPAEPRIAPYAADYFMMTALPATLDPAEPLARAVYERGWRPRLAEGPDRDELIEILGRRQTAVAGR